MTCLLIVLISLAFMSPVRSIDKQINGRSPLKVGLRVEFSLNFGFILAHTSHLSINFYISRDMPSQWYLFKADNIR